MHQIGRIREIDLECGFDHNANPHFCWRRENYNFSLIIAVVGGRQAGAIYDMGGGMCR